MSTVESVRARLGELEGKVTDVEGELVGWQLRDVEWAGEYCDKALSRALRRRKGSRLNDDLISAEWYCDRIELALEGISYDHDYQKAAAWLHDKRVAREQASRGEQVA